MQVPACINEVALWMQSNRLQLNTAKTEIVWCATNRRQHLIPQTPTRIGDDYITPAASVRDLGIYIDSDVSMKLHVSRTVSTCFTALRQIRSIRHRVPRAGASFTGRVTGLVAGGLRQRHASGCSSLRHQQTAVSVECRCSSRVLVAEVRLRDVTSARVALSEGGAAD